MKNSSILALCVVLSCTIEFFLWSLFGPFGAILGGGACFTFGAMFGVWLGDKPTIHIGNR